MRDAAASRLGSTGMTGIAPDTGLSMPRDHSGLVAVGRNVGSRPEIDAAFAQAVARGARPVEAPAARSYGKHAACFRDLDGHLRGVVFNPRFAWRCAGAVRSARVRRVV